MGTAGTEGTAESWAVGTEGPWGQRDIGTEGTEGTPGSLTEAQLSPSGSLCWLQPRAPRDRWVGDTEVTPALLSRHFRGLGVTCSHLTAVPSLAAALMSFRDDFISFYFLSFPPGVTETTTLFSLSLSLSEDFVASFPSWSGCQDSTSDTELPLPWEFGMSHVVTPAPSPSPQSFGVLGSPNPAAGISQLRDLQNPKGRIHPTGGTGGFVSLPARACAANCLLIVCFN